jgi:hypothetical protein
MPLFFEETVAMLANVVSSRAPLLRSSPRRRLKRLPRLPFARRLQNSFTFGTLWKAILLV